MGDGRRVGVTVPSAYLASLVTEETGCGGVGNPWTIEVSRGQRLRVTLFDFNVARSRVMAQGIRGQRCPTYAVVQELLITGARKVSLCGGGVARERQVYTSTTNRLEIGLMANDETVAMETPYFLLKYEGRSPVHLDVLDFTWI